MIKNPIYCAIDTSSVIEAENITKEILPFVGGIKVGLEFFTSCGILGLERLAKFELPLFIDLKLYDIPNTVKNSLQNILSFQPEFTTLHISGGSNMLRESVELKRNLGSSTNLIGVTMLTSFDDNSIKEVGISGSVDKNVENLANLAFNCGMDGIVCSPLEIKKIKKIFGSGFYIVVPGIRNETNEFDDQKRTLSAKEAIDFGADIIVVGRPITSAKSPANAAESFYQSIT